MGDEGREVSNSPAPNLAPTASIWSLEDLASAPPNPKRVTA